jgi:hypothetical protein
MLTCIYSSQAGAAWRQVEALFQTPTTQRAFWDAVKKSLDAGRKPVNLTVIRGIKASCQSERAGRFRLLKPGESIV